MKTSKLIIACICISLMTFFSCQPQKAKQDEQGVTSKDLDDKADTCNYDTISERQAKEYFKNYMNEPGVTNSGKFKGIMISKYAMKCIYKALKADKKDLDGFRIYMGIRKDSTSSYKGYIIVGVTNLDNSSNGADVPPHGVNYYWMEEGDHNKSNKKKISPCPPVCDVQSPVTTP